MIIYPPISRFLEGFNYLREKYDHVGDCRGKGLMMAMEFVESKSTNNPMPTYKMNAILERTKVLLAFFPLGID